jgi:hypothetical protein
MERKEIIRHDNDSVTTEGEGVMERYLDHKFEHDKGKGECDEHTGMYDHEDMHKIPHNDNPISDWVSKGVKKAKGVINDVKGIVGVPEAFAADYGKNISGTLTENPQSLKKVRQKQQGAWQGIIE